MKKIYIVVDSSGDGYGDFATDRLAWAFAALMVLNGSVFDVEEAWVDNDYICNNGHEPEEQEGL